MKFGDLRSVAHNAADSLSSGLGFPIGLYVTDIYGEAGQSPGGVIGVDFLTGQVIEGVASESPGTAVELYRDAFKDLCRRHGCEADLFRVATARFGIDSSLGIHFTVHIEDRNGRTATDRYIGTPGQKL
ncbi:hypothetical protein GCM10009422_18420 [Brevundimonas kwangchunensis]|uniref:Uncharacterized protein n=1 Tax=Brevundimonas kwangchunensis TaxID=322163 RepID=A0ABP3S4E8_9CAUL